MWGWAMGGAPLLLLLLLPPGAVGLQCLSCGAGSSGCSDVTNVTCPTESDVCAEALAAVTWSHGQFAIGWRGCGRGQPGSLARALELGGLVVFERRRHCGGGACNDHLPLGQQGALPLPANSSAQTPNGVRCFGCPEGGDGPCPPLTIVECYDDLSSCFHGNVTLRLGNATLWRELRGCARPEGCARGHRGDADAALAGSCCTGDLCNGHAANGSLFEPDRPRLELLPHGHAPTAPPAPTNASGGHTGGGGDNGDTSKAAGDKGGGGDKMADGGDKMAERDKTVTDEDKMAADGDKMAADGDKMAADGDKMADRDKMADGDKMADKKMADGDKMADNKMGDKGDKMADGDKMAAGREGRKGVARGGAKGGTKGPVGRGHPLAGPGWLLPFLLLPLLR